MGSPRLLVDDDSPAKNQKARNSLRRVFLALVVFILVPACSLPLPPVLGFLGTDTPTATITPSPTYTHTPTFTNTPTITPSPTFTFTPSSTATATFTASNTPKPLVLGAGYAGSVIMLVNNERTSRGLPGLKINWTLMVNAQAWSNYMAVNNVFTHSGQNVAENIAAGYSSPGAAVSAWMGSSGHRANILNASYTQVGAGYAYNASSTAGHYWTLQLLP